MKNEKTLIVTLLLIFVWPMGLPVMWLSGAYKKKTRIIITLTFLISTFLGLLMIILWTSSPGYMY